MINFVKKNLKIRSQNRIEFELRRGGGLHTSVKKLNADNTGHNGANEHQRPFHSSNVLFLLGQNSKNRLI